MLARTLSTLLAAASLGACAGFQSYPGYEPSPAPQRDRELLASLRAELDRAPICCSSLAALPYQDIPGDGALTSEIDVRSPAFVFEGGKSFFAAYRLDQVRRPFILEVASAPSPAPGVSGEAGSDSPGLRFVPAVLLLDGDFKVRRSVSGGAPAQGCAEDVSMDAYLLSLDILEPVEQSKYLVVLTTDVLLGMENVVACGRLHSTPSPVGRVSLRVHGLPFDDGPLLLKTPAKRYLPARGGGMADLMSPSLLTLLGQFVEPFDNPGLLVLGGSALHFLKEAKDSRYAEELSIPYDAISEVQAVGPDGHLKLPHLWPGQTPPPPGGETGGL